MASATDVLGAAMSYNHVLPKQQNSNEAPRPADESNQHSGNGSRVLENSTQPITLLILGINGFIGHHLCRRVLEKTNWSIRSIDISMHRISKLIDNSRYKDRLQFRQSDIDDSWDWVEAQIKECQVVLPLAAIATPSSYVQQPLRVFELDFEVSLRIIRLVAKYKKRLIFPSTSEVYGMCSDKEFDTEESELVCGPIRKSRWIYSCAKQLLDRVMFAYGEEGLNFTIFRPFNWIGPGLDSLDAAKPGSSRVTTQFLGHITRGENITLVDGGLQRRTFTFIDDGIDALMAIIINKNGIASGKIYNIGNPANNCSIRELATLMITTAKTMRQFADMAAKVQLMSRDSTEYYGEGYQDVQNRTPKITATTEDFGWKPAIMLEQAVYQLFAELN